MKLRQFFFAICFAGAFSCLSQPVITSQPDSQTNVVDDSTFFYVIAPDATNYVWRRNGSSANIPNDPRIAGKTTSYLQIDSVKATDAGTYTVVVTDSTGKSVTSSNAVLTVLVPPVLTVQPVSQTKIAGSNVTFTVRLSTLVAPTQPLSFQWFHDGELLVDTNGIAGSTSTNLTLTNLESSDEGDYWVVVSNPATDSSGLDVYSTNATLTVLIPPTINSFTVDDDRVVDGYPAIFTVYADGSDDLRYIWKLNGNVIIVESDGVLPIYDASPSDQGTYTVEVRSSAIDAISQQIIKATSTPIFLTVLVPPSIVTQPQSKTVSAGTSVTLFVRATGTAPLSYQWMFNDNPIDGATATNYTFFAADTSFAGTYSVIISNEADVLPSDPAIITVVAETQKPTIAITFPSEGGRWSNSVITIRGTASDNAEVEEVFWTLNDANMDAHQLLADGTTNWTATFPLTIPGTNIFRVRSHDTSGNYSTMLTRKFIYVLAAPLMLYTNGVGSVTPNLGGQLLEIGKQYTLTAKPGVGQLFASWSGGVSSTNPVLTFTMQSNLVAQANFIPNPFIPRKGTYSGLFSRTNGDGTMAVEHQTSGFFTLKLTDKGKFSCKIQMGGAKYSCSGTFNINGVASATILRSGLPSLVVSLQMDVNTQNDQVTGTITDGNFVAELNGDRAVFNAALNPAPQIGKYNLAFVSQSSSQSIPNGDGFGAVAVDGAGKVKLKGSLADGISAGQKGVVSKNGQWPFYLNLYSGKGSMLGWLTFTNRGTGSIEGTVSWIKTSLAIGKNYTSGFTTTVETAGSHYNAPLPGAKVLNISNGEVILSGDGLDFPVTNGITFNANNTVTIISGTNNLALAITTSSGAVKGSFIHPTTHLTTPIKGTVLPEQNILRGFFLTPTQSGGVLMESQ